MTNPHPHHRSPSPRNDRLFRDHLVRARAMSQRLAHAVRSGAEERGVAPAAAHRRLLLHAAGRDLFGRLDAVRRRAPGMQNGGADGMLLSA